MRRTPPLHDSGGLGLRPDASGPTGTTTRRGESAVEQRSTEASVGDGLDTVRPLIRGSSAGGGVARMLMTSHYAIQARLVEHRQGVIVRDETRLGRTTALADAEREARSHAADGFKVWIYRVEDTSGTRPTYVTVEILQPVVAASDSRRGPGGARRSRTDLKGSAS